MIDLRFARENPDLLRASQQARGQDPALVDQLLAADTERRATVTRADQLRAEQKSLGAAIQAASGDERAALLDKAKSFAAQLKEVEAQQAAADEALRIAQLAIPNVVAQGVPTGGEDDFVVVETIGEIPQYDFEVKDHIDVGKQVEAFDLERGAKVSGSRFYFLTGVGALLELALLNFAIKHAEIWGFNPMIAPALVKPEAMEGTGFLGAHADEVYRLERDDLYLVGTSEVPLAAYHSNEILPGNELPLHYAGFSPCFRREAGSHGKDTRGIFRVHWFDKVEMFSFVNPSEAETEHQKMLECQKEFLQKLELPFRVIDTASGDLGSSAVRRYDCEAWFPAQGRYRELTSTSNCTTYQARRLGIRYRDEDGKVAPVATLNGTVCAITRTIACLLEVHQQANGRVRIPVSLRSYMRGSPEILSMQEHVDMEKALHEEQNQ